MGHGRIAFQGQPDNSAPIRLCARNGWKF